MTDLLTHFQKMQAACANYIEPTTYIARHPTGEPCKWNTEFPEPNKHQASDGAFNTKHRREQAFVNDIIYMLDGPEQREAQASCIDLVDRLRAIQECISDGSSIFPDTASMIEAIEAYADLELPNVPAPAAAIAKLEAERAWQPIATAPRDGTLFIAALTVRHSQTGASWQEAHVIWADDETGGVHHDCDHGWSRIDDYEWWMPVQPIPATPTPGN